MNNIKERPSQSASKQEWEEYLNSRIEWKISLDKYDIDAKANLSYNEQCEVWNLYVELNSHTKHKVNIRAAIYDVNNNIKDNHLVVYNTIDGFWVGDSTIQMKRLYAIDRVVIYGEIDG